MISVQITKVKAFGVCQSFRYSLIALDLKLQRCPQFICENFFQSIMDTARPLYPIPKKRRRSILAETEVVSRRMVNFFAAAWRLERKSARQNDGFRKQMASRCMDLPKLEDYEKQLVSMNLDMQKLKEDVDKINEVKIKTFDEKQFQEKLQVMEDKLAQSLDGFAKVASALRTDQEKLATNLVQATTTCLNGLQDLEKQSASSSPFGLQDLEKKVRAKLQEEMTTTMREVANETWKSKANCFFKMVEARMEKELTRMRGMMMGLREISGDDFGDSDDPDDFYMKSKGKGGMKGKCKGQGKKAHGKG